MLGIEDGPRWETIVGGSRRYVDRIGADLGAAVRLGRAPVLVNETTLHFSDGAVEPFDAVVLATHADEALALLADPSADERAALGPWRYQRTTATLHSDPSVMPADRGAWASWNYVQSAADGPTLTYHLDRLQGPAGLARAYFLTLGPCDVAEPLLVTSFTHPLYDEAAVATQPRLRALNGVGGRWYAGNYLGSGFHEDAVRAGAEVAAALGCPLERVQGT
jgi:predicted NAD/FAD-binding protein